MNVIDYVKNNITYLDGGLGSQLLLRGMKPGESSEQWNITHPEEVTEVHRNYYNAGANIVAANTFGINALKYDEPELSSLIHAAIDNVKAAREQSTGKQEKFIAFDVGSAGKLLKPYGDLAFEDAVNIYAKAMAVGVECGVDLIFIETMNDSLDTKAALLAAKETCDLPVFVSNAYGEDGKLMTGATPASMVAMLEGMGADAIGINCSLGPKQLKGVVKEYLEYASVPVLVKPNAGLPKSVNGETVYDVLPEEFAEDVAAFVADGVRIAGGCCGTTPDYIKAVVEKTAGLSPVPVVEKNRTLISSYTHAVEFDKSPILIGERINPTGKKKLKEALRANDMDYILSEGLREQDNGAHVLDVNVGLPEIDEPAVLKKVCYELQAIIDLPLQIDTSDPKAMEAALRGYNGKAMINSVNGKEEVMREIFPLAKKYGGLVVCLTLDEDGIPETAEKRVAIAKKIISVAQSYGIKKKDLIFDTLAMTVSADKNAALATIEALNIIRNELGCHTSLGVSNVSFGLPNREIITAAFFALALEKGLSAAIMNPAAGEMMKTYYSFRALHGLDDNCSDYIQNIGKYAAAPTAGAAGAGNSGTSGNTTGGTGSSGSADNAAGGTGSSGSADNAAGTPGTGNASEESRSELSKAVIRGLKDQAAAITVKLLENTDPLEIVNKDIIPALDVVGQGFERKTMYLPQLLMSAEAAQSAFAKIKEKIGDSGKSAGRGKFVIATVKGDIHDIGKNIVKLILENYGFEVFDLGKDVSPETIVDCAIRENAPYVGLSALMTTTVPAMAETITLLREKAPEVKVVVGGAVLTKEYADEIGADFYAKDAMATVRYAMGE